jgi:hypothetical protein
VRSFNRRAGQGIAIFRDEIVSFRCSKRIPESAYSGGVDRLTACKGFKLKWMVSPTQVREATATRSRKDVHLTVLTHENRQFMATMDPAESGHLLEALAALLGERFQCSIAPDTLAPKRAKMGIALPVVLAVAGLALLYFTLQNVRTLAFGLAFLMILFYVSVGMIVAGSSTVMRTIASRRGHRGHARPFRSRRIGIVLRVLAIGIFVLAAFQMQWLARHMEQLGLLQAAPEHLNRKHDISDQWMIDFAINMMVSTLFTVLAVALAYVGYRLSLRDRERTDEDPSSTQPPVLYLRSFDDDGKHDLNSQGWLSTLLGMRPIQAMQKLGPVANVNPIRLGRMLFGSVTDTAEEQLGSFFRKMGPFVAIGRPGELFSTGGADRVYVEDHAWQDQVLKWLGSSQAIVLQPAATKGIWWEIENVVQRTDSKRVLLSLASFDRCHQEYDEFRLKFEDRIGHPLPRSLDSIAFIHFEDQSFKPNCVASVHRSHLTWPLAGTTLDLRRTLHDFLHRLAPERYANRPRRPLNLGFVTATLALLLYTLVPFSFFAAIGAFFGQNSALSALSTGKSIDYPVPGDARWSLDAGWKQTDEIPGATLAFTADNNAAKATLAVNPLPSRTTFDALQRAVMSDFMFRGLDATLLSQSDERIDSRRWRTLHLLVKQRGAPFDIHSIVRLSFDHDRTYVQSLAVANWVLHGMPWHEKTLMAALDGLHLAPLSPEQKEAADATLESAIASTHVIPQKGPRLPYAYSLKPGFVRVTPASPRYDDTFAFRDSDDLVLRIASRRQPYTRDDAADALRQEMSAYYSSSRSSPIDEKPPTGSSFTWTEITDMSSGDEQNRAGTAAFAFDDDSKCAILLIGTYPKSNDATMSRTRELMNQIAATFAPPKDGALVRFSLSSDGCSITVPFDWREVPTNSAQLLLLASPDQTKVVVIERVDARDGVEAEMIETILLNFANNAIKVTSNNRRPVTWKGNDLIETVIRGSMPDGGRILHAHRFIRHGGFVYHVGGVRIEAKGEPDLSLVSPMLDRFELSSSENSGK